MASWRKGLAAARGAALGAMVLLAGSAAPAAEGPAPGGPTTRPKGTPATQPAETNRWEKAIRAYEERDSNDPPPKDAIVFVGSSSIRGWDTKKYLPDLVTIQRGFGGSQMSDSVHFAHRIVIPYRPRVAVVYAGDNDIASGKTPQRVLEDYQALVRKVHDALPKTRIVYIAIKPSLARWKLVETMRQANRLIEQFTKTDPRLRFVDVDKPMLGEDGKPRKELFKADGLHLNHEGYVLWSKLLRPHLTDPSTAPGEDPQR